jgi:hypothetical protein
MGKQIGAGTIAKFGSAAAPTTLVDKSSFLKNADVQEMLDTVDITDLTADADGYAKTFIAALFSATISGAGDEDVVASASAFKFFHDAAHGTAHASGRGKIDFELLLGGAVTGNLKMSGTVLVTNNSLNAAHDGSIAGNRSFQVDGALTLAAQS